MKHRGLGALVSIIVIPAATSLFMNLLGRMDGLLNLEFAMMVLFSAMTYLMCMMWLGDIDVKYMNGWERWDDEDRRALMHYLGFTCTLSMIILSSSIALTFTGRLWALWLVAPAMVLIFAPMVFAIGDHFSRKAPLLHLSDSGRHIIALVLCLLAVAPFCFIGSTSEGVVMELGDDYFNLKAPMVDETFPYAEVEDLRLDEDFDRGFRKAGFATLTLESGRFHNDEFGDYQLASNVNVAPCITFSHDGRHFAFNLSSIEKTEEMFLDLLSRCNA